MSPQRLGQHFLADASWRKRIVQELAPCAEDVFVEIGAGHGEMTRELAARCRRVIAIELDAPLVKRLEELAAEAGNVEVAPGDVLALDLAKVLPREGCRVYGSLPYYITSPILRRLFEQAERIRRVDVVIQWEVAARIAAKPGRREYGFLSVLAQFYAEQEILLRIPPGAFRPRPKVTSALVGMKMRREREKAGDERGFLEFVGACFGQKRKTLRNNLKAMVGSERAAEWMQAAGVKGNARAEELSVKELAKLYFQKHDEHG